MNTSGIPNTLSSQSSAFPRAFAVWWKDLPVWSPASFFRAAWHWPSENIKPLAVALERKSIAVDQMSERLPLISLRFDGTLELRSNPSKEFKGKLFEAHAGDLVYSKIDARNGAIGIVPQELNRVAVSSEYPVYAVRSDIASSAYLKLLLRSAHLQNIINSMKSGASGRKRVQPSEIEKIEVPLPSLNIQQAIVRHWQQAQDAECAARERIEQHEQDIESEFLSDLGLKPIVRSESPKAFSVWWKDLDRWDVLSAQSSIHDNVSKTYVTEVLSNVILSLQHTNKRLTPKQFPKRMFNYIGMENVEARTGRLVEFKPIEGKQIRSSSVIFDGQHILYGKLRPYLRKTFVPAEHDLNEGIASSEFIAIKPRPQIRLDFLAEYLRSNIVAQQAQRAIGARMPRVSIEDFLNFKIPLPPLEVQKRIMERVEAGRAQIACERDAADCLASEAKAEVESLILGTKKIEDVM